MTILWLQIITYTHTYIRRAVLNSSVYGITYAFSQSIIYLMYAVVFRFGAFQVTRDAGNIAHVSFQDVFRVFIALIFGAVGVGQAGAFAPDYTKARLSANRIFAILDRVPVIDGYSKEGSKIVSEAFLPLLFLPIIILTSGSSLRNCWGFISCRVFIYIHM